MIFSFAVKKRGEEKAEAIRAKGLIPGILYGKGLESVSVTIEAASFSKLYSGAGESSLIDLSVDEGKPVKVLIQDLQYDPVKGKITHVDFRQIDMNKEMHATLKLIFVGEAPAVKELGGTLVKAQDSLHIKCLPKDLVSEVNVDLSNLKTFENIIHVKDLQLPAGITATEDLNQVIVKVAAPLTEEQLKAMEEAAAPSLDQIEVEKKGKEETVEAGAEGEAKKDEKKEEKK